MSSKAAKDPTKVAEGVIDAFNRSDWESLRSNVAEDIVYQETGTGRRIQGVDAYLELCQGWKQVFADGAGTVRNMVASGGTVAQEVIWEGTHTGPLTGPGGTLPPTGRRVPVTATMWYMIAGGRVREIHHHIDLMTMLQGLGACLRRRTPEPNGSG